MQNSPRLTLFACSAATLLVLVAFTLPLTVLAPIVRNLHASSSDRTWMLSAMSLGLAALLLASGTVADDIGRRRVFLGGGAVFIVASAAAALARDPVVFILGRGAQGLGGAALLASSLALLAEQFRGGEARTHATGIWGAMFGAGVAIGPTAGALLASAGSWRLAYWGLTGASLLATAFAATVLPESRAERRRRLDLPGLVLLSAGLVAVVAALVRGNPDGWTSRGVLALFALGAALLGGFVTVARIRDDALIDLDLFRRPTFVAALGGSLCLGLSVLALFSYLPGLLQDALHTTALTAALALLPWSLVSVLVAWRARTIGRLLAPRMTLAMGMVLCAAGELAMLGLRREDSWRHLLAGLLIAGVGTGLLNAGLARASVAVVPLARSGMGAGANNTARYLGAAIGVAIVAAIVQAQPPTPAGAAHGFDLAAVVCAAFCAAGALIALRLVRQVDFARAELDAGPDLART
ncbi:MAG: MFS transporter [Solirubrobacterales bacterium]|nr:MFS transporter [Solirubrobacterales bacterium]